MERESTIFQCTHGDPIAYPLVAIELEIQGKPVLVNYQMLSYNLSWLEVVSLDC